MLNVRCPRCQTALKIPDQYAGKVVKCPACTKPIHLPEFSPADEAADRPKLDFGSMAEIEQAGEALMIDRRRRKRMSLKEAQAAAGPSKRPANPNLRLCPVCGAEVRASDPYSEVICKECDTPIPGVAGGGAEDARYSDSLAGRIRAPVTFYTGFASALLYPIPALMWIIAGIGIALAAIVVPAGMVLGFAAGASLNPISEETDFSWVGLFLTIMFVLEGIYFGLVDYHILIDSIRTTSAGSEQPPTLVWSPANLGTALLGYVAIFLYYTAILTLLVLRAHHGVLDFPNTREDLNRLLTPGNIAILALVTFMIPMNLIGLASGRSIDGLNPVRVIRSIAAVPAHYVFLFLICLLYLGMYTGVMVGVISWAGGAILDAARYGISKGLTATGMGLAAWAVMIGLGFFVSYSLGRIVGLFARTYKDKLDFDL